MAETQTQPAAKAMTAADAAKLVKRKLTERKPVMKGGEQARDKDGTLLFEDVTREVAIGAGEVLAFKDYGTHVVVVTKDGKKFSSAADE
jgi:hypothetical protein